MYALVNDVADLVHCIVTFQSCLYFARFLVVCFLPLVALRVFDVECLIRYTFFAARDHKLEISKLRYTPGLEDVLEEFFFVFQTHESFSWQLK